MKPSAVDVVAAREDQSLKLRSSPLEDAVRPPPHSSGSCLNPYSMINPRYTSKARCKTNLDDFRSKIGDPDAYPLDYYITVPCGLCAGCMKDKSRNWRVRLLMEHRYGNHTNCIFCTLTISPEHEEKYFDSGRSCLSRLIRSFLDRLRYYTRDRKTPKHWFVTELGEEHGRLHFHGFIWDVDFRFHELRKCWKVGFTWFRPLRDASDYTYCTKYISKPALEWHKPMVFTSPGLGKGYVDNKKYFDFHHGDPDYYLRMYVDFPRYRYRLPAYYRDKIFTYDERYCYQELLQQDSRPRPSFFLGRRYDDSLRLIEDRQRLFQLSLSLGRSKVRESPPTNFDICNEEQFNKI